MKVYLKKVVALFASILVAFMLGCSNIPKSVSVKGISEMWYTQLPSTHWLKSDNVELDLPTKMTLDGQECDTQVVVGMYKMADGISSFINGLSGLVGSDNSKASDVDVIKIITDALQTEFKAKKGSMQNAVILNNIADKVDVIAGSEQTKYELKNSSGDVLKSIELVSGSSIEVFLTDYVFELDMTEASKIDNLDYSTKDQSAQASISMRVPSNYVIAYISNPKIAQINDNKITSLSKGSTVVIFYLNNECVAYKINVK